MKEAKFHLPALSMVAAKPTQVGYSPKFGGEDTSQSRAKDDAYSKAKTQLPQSISTLGRSSHICNNLLSTCKGRKKSLDIGSSQGLRGRDTHF